VALAVHLQDKEETTGVSTRRQGLQQLAKLSVALPSFASLLLPTPARADILADREKERKYIQESYSDFTKTNEGWLFREVKPGTGEKARVGDRYVQNYLL
jgi:hypothetical protein